MPTAAPTSRYCPACRCRSRPTNCALRSATISPARARRSPIRRFSASCRSALRWRSRKATITCRSRSRPGLTGPIEGANEAIRPRRIAVSMAVMYFADLAPYRHGIPAALNDVLTVGWLSKIASFPRRDTTDQVVDALGRLLVSHRVNQMRGYHDCEFCTKRMIVHETRFKRKIVLGSAEIWIPALEQPLIYAAP